MFQNTGAIEEEIIRRTRLRMGLTYVKNVSLSALRVQLVLKLGAGIDDSFAFPVFS